MPHLKRVGLIGCGAIGTYIATLLKDKFKKQARLAFVCDIQTEKARALGRVVSLKTLVAKSDFIIEAAHADVVSTLVPLALKKNKSILVMSVGGLLNVTHLAALLAKSKGTVYIPSGAIAGIDALCAAMQDGLQSVTLTTRKPVQGLQGAPILKEKGIDLASIKSETVLFEGTAREAVKAFPQNVNVAAVLSLATLGPEHVRVKVITSPEFKKNSHEIMAEGKCGKIRTLVENEPSETNPKTSALAQYSVAATLEKIFSKIKIGT
ncbi:MAG: DUF108 domain-containing protein [Candidatus Omnitrophica bacterium]|nr:DUF108 domain-containing protein [Candidatus Omnitrophota bacterium]